MQQTVISTAIAHHVAVVTMNRPPVNAANLQLFIELTATFDALSSDDDVRAVILTGSGHVFCAGADLKDKNRGRDASVDAQRLRAANETFFAVMNSKKPTLAAINGPALGAGLVLAVSCDILMASENAFLALPEVSLGLLGGAKHAMRVLNHSLTRRMMFTGYRASASELYRRGFIEKCVAPETLPAEAMTIAQEMASSNPRVTQMAKRALNCTEYMTLRDGYAHEQALTLDLLAERYDTNGE